MERKENQITLRGTAAETPTLSHQSRGLDFYRFPLSVPRLSGKEDRLNIFVPSGLPLPREGDYVEISGEVRSFNNRTGSGNRLIITVLAQTVAPGFGTPCNLVTLRGRLCKPPVRRRTPLGRDICEPCPTTAAACSRETLSGWRAGCKAGSIERSWERRSRSGPPLRFLSPRCRSRQRRNIRWESLNRREKPEAHSLRLFAVTQMKCFPGRISPVYSQIIHKYRIHYPQFVRTLTVSSN